MDQQAHAQIAVVTVKTTGDDTIDDFAGRLEEKWKVGQKGTDRGLLFLIATDDHHYSFEVGYGLEGILPDGKVGSIGREMVPYLREGNYDAADHDGDAGVCQRDCAGCGRHAENARREFWPWTQPHPRSAVKDILLALFAIFVFISLVRSGPSGWAGFLLGMFLGVWAEAAEVVAVLAAAMVAAEDLVVSAAVVPAAVGLLAAGKRFTVAGYRIQIQMHRISDRSTTR